MIQQIVQFDTPDWIFLAAGKPDGKVQLLMRRKPADGSVARSFVAAFTRRDIDALMSCLNVSTHRKGAKNDTENRADDRG